MPTSRPEGVGLFIATPGTQQQLTEFGKEYMYINSAQEASFIVSTIYVTPHHQMRHKSQIQKLRVWNNMIEDNTSFIMVNELCFYHN